MTYSDQRKSLGLSDVLWYLTATRRIRVQLEEFALNIDKLQSRKRRGRIKGSGDYR